MIRIKERISQIVIVLLIVGIGAITLYYDQIHDPFVLSSVTFASQEHNPDTYKKYTLSIQNKSKYSIKLIDVRLENYSGIDVGEILSKTGESINEKGLTVPSHLVKYGENSWSTQGEVNLQFDVLVNEQKFVNPKHALLTYTVFGLKLTQKLQLPPID